MTPASNDQPGGALALVGYGEVGRIFGAALVNAGCRVVAFDIQCADNAWLETANVRARQDGVALAHALRDAVASCPLVISAVTAAATATAALQIASTCAPDAFVLDLNSAAPQTKRAGADAVTRAGGRYVEAAVMSSVPPHGLRVPMLLGGPHAAALQPTLDALGFAASIGSPNYGVVSAIKLCRSVIVKGMEALAVESLLTARRYGVEREVLASLAETFPAFDWEKQGTYFWRRVVQHGRRRAEEMREAAVAVADAGVPPRMAQSTAEVQQWIATLRAGGVFANVGDASWRDFADAVARTLEEGNYADEKPNSARGVSHMSVRRADASGNNVSANPSNTP